MVYEYIKNEDGTFTCPHCQEVKKNQSTMHMHYRARHDGAYKHKCKNCQYETSTKQSLDKHIAAKHPDQVKEKPKACACPSCEFTCLSKGGLRSHYLLRHMAAEVKKYLAHTEEDEIQCSHCGSEFASKPAFIYHLAGCLPNDVLNDTTHREGLGLA
jgi:KRAB domain-containing zinc finger protein